MGPPPGREDQGSPQGNGTSNVSQPEAIKLSCKLLLDTKSFSTIETDALVTYVFDESDPVQGRIAELDKLAGGLIARLSKSGELTGKNLEITLVHAPAGLKTARLLLVGAGKREQFNPGTLRKVAGAALRYLKARSVHKVAFLLRENDLNENSGTSRGRGSSCSRFRDGQI